MLFFVVRSSWTSWDLCQTFWGGLGRPRTEASQKLKFTPATYTWLNDLYLFLSFCAFLWKDAGTNSFNDSMIIVFFAFCSCTLKWQTGAKGMATRLTLWYFAARMSIAVKRLDWTMLSFNDASQCLIRLRLGSKFANDAAATLWEGLPWERDACTFCREVCALEALVCMDFTRSRRSAISVASEIAISLLYFQWRHSCSSQGWSGTSRYLALGPGAVAWQLHCPNHNSCLACAG